MLHRRREPEAGCSPGCYSAITFAPRNVRLIEKGVRNWRAASKRIELELGFAILESIDRVEKFGDSGEVLRIAPVNQAGGLVRCVGFCADKRVESATALRGRAKVARAIYLAQSLQQLVRKTARFWFWYDRHIISSEKKLFGDTLPVSHLIASEIFQLARHAGAQQENHLTDAINFAALDDLKRLEPIKGVMNCKEIDSGDTTSKKFNSPK